MVGAARAGWLGRNIGGERQMSLRDIKWHERILIAPPELCLATRFDFRRAALKALWEMPEGAGRLIVDLTSTDTVDSAGLSSLILMQRRAASRRQVVRLRGVNEELRFLLVLTKLEDLFEIEEQPAV